MNVACSFAKAGARSYDLTISWVGDDHASKRRSVVVCLFKYLFEEHPLEPGAIACHEELAEIVYEEHGNPAAVATAVVERFDLRPDRFSIHSGKVV